MVGDIVVQELVSALQSKETQKITSCSATVTRTDDDGIIWVQIAGSQSETPTATTAAEVKCGDTVTVEWRNNKLYIISNYSNPSAGVTRVAGVEDVANAAKGSAIEAVKQAGIARSAADQAVEDATTAKEAATEAKINAAEAKQFATTAKEAAELAVEDATTAKEAAESAVKDATTAYNQSVRATNSANSALTQLSIVEDVVGTLKWITEHGQYVLTADTTVQDGTVYFVYDTEAQDYTPIVSPDADANPQTEGWYVLNITEAQTDFIMSHIAVTSRGLWILPNGIGSDTTPASGETQKDSDARQGSGYKVLLSNTGMVVYDESGTAVSLFGESITFNSTRPQRIGGDQAYIEYYDSNGDGVADSLRIVGASMTFSDGSNVEKAINNSLTYTHTYTVTNGVATFEAFLYRGGVDVKTEYEESCFSWYLKTETGKADKGTGYTKTFNLSECGYGAEVIGRFHMADDSEALANNGDSLTDENGDPVTVRASGGSVRVCDLSTTTEIYDSQRLLVVGNSEEHLTTMSAMYDYMLSKMESGEFEIYCGSAMEMVG